MILSTIISLETVYKDNICVYNIYVHTYIYIYIYILYVCALSQQWVWNPHCGYPIYYIHTIYTYMYELIPIGINI